MGEYHTPAWLWGSAAKGWAAIETSRAGFRKVGLPDLCLVAMRGPVTEAADYREQLGLDAITAYTTFGGDDYAGLAASNVAWWEQASEMKVPLIPPLNCGWGGPRPGGTPDKQPTTDQLAAHIRHAVRWVGEHPQSAPAKAVLGYAWNEFDEGGWLCPTRGADGKPDTSHIKALGLVAPIPQSRY